MNATHNIRIPVYKPSITDVEKAYVNKCLDDGWISSLGEFIPRFENNFANYIGIDYATSVSNGTTALHAALLAVGIGAGDEVIVPTLTYVATANSVCYTGARPVFVDCDPKTWQMDPDDIRRVLSSKTRAILPVHLYGHPCDMASICQIAEEKGLLVIEDCAEAVGSFFGDQHVGTFGEIATFSFYGNKTITAGEGGMVVTNNSNLAERTRHLKGQGLARSREYWHDIIGYNYRMTNICAAIGCAQLERLEETLTRKRQIAERYRERLDGVVQFQDEAEGVTHSHWMVCFLVERAAQREEVRAFLATNGIETRPVFYPIHSMPMYARSFRRMSYSDDIGSRGINLPSFPELTNDQVDLICKAVRRALSDA